MTEGIYQKLAKHLDDLPGGFPPTDSGVEMRILKRLFAPEEAELALHLTLIAEEPKVVARRAKISRQEAEQRLATMAKKGLIYKIYSKKNQPTYMAAQYLMGIWEFHVDDLDLDFVKYMDEYFPVLLKEAWKIPQLRTIPVNASLNSELSVMTYENAENLVCNVKKAAVAPCICRRERRLLGEGCDKLGEVCLLFGEVANFYIENGFGRKIDHPEVLEILKKADEAGLVLQSTNFQKIINICCCCGCCCGVLRNIKSYPKPASLISPSFFAVSSPHSCNGCGVCEDRCQMQAVQVVNEKAAIDTDRCIGCGLCVSTCPMDSLSLVRKPDTDQPKVPEHMMQTALELWRARGKPGMGNLIKMRVKSKVDRLLAAR